MRAILGIVLIFGGLLLAYVVLAGKFPPSAAPTSSSSSSAAASGGGLLLNTSTPSAPAPAPSRTVIDPLGLPTMSALYGQDKLASSGGMQL